MVSVQPSKESMQAIPVKAQTRIKSSRSVKFRRYHVATPSTEQADISNHHPSGMVRATASTSLGCRLKSVFSPTVGAVLYRRNGAPTSCAGQSRRDVGPIFPIVRYGYTFGIWPTYDAAILVYSHPCDCILFVIRSSLDCAMAWVSRSTRSRACLGCK